MEEKDDFWANVESEQDKSIPSMMISDNQASEPVMITGTPQQISGTQHQMILMQQPSSAPKVIGVFVIIWGGLQILSTIGGAFINDILPEASQIDATMQWYDYLFSLLSIAFGLGFIYAGTAISNRQKFGVHLTWILLSVGLVLGIVMAFFEPMPDAPDGQEVNKSLFLGIAIGGQLFCNAICGLLAAIPLMASNTLMEPIIEKQTGSIEWSDDVPV
tara:strand:- start:1609 stop:2259 length:651 start_codon:yes stop_codon:yes gene_type:complete